MKKTVNTHTKNKTKFYNRYIGKGDHKFFFALPCIGISPKKNLHWDMTIKSYFFGFMYWFFQLNVYEIMSDNTKDLSKENFEKLKKILRQAGLTISNLQDCLIFIKNNIFIVHILKNTHQEHPYVVKILSGVFQNQPFIDNVPTN